LRSTWRNARRPAAVIVTSPTPTTTGRHIGSSLNAGANRATTTIPALTMVAECRNALTAVGAVMAAGNQEWNG
jgi:hypothetical protein